MKDSQIRLISTKLFHNPAYPRTWRHRPSRCRVVHSASSILSVYAYDLTISLLHRPPISIVSEYRLHFIVMPVPPFGSASAYTDSFPSPPPRQVTISAETCFNLSLFKGESGSVRPVGSSLGSFPCWRWRVRPSADMHCWGIDMVKQYRRLDDQIITRLNRASAQLRDQSRLSGSGPSSWSRGRGAGAETLDGAEGMCVRIWGEMMGQCNLPLLHPRLPIRLCSMCD